MAEDRSKIPRKSVSNPIHPLSVNWRTGCSRISSGGDSSAKSARATWSTDGQPDQSQAFRSSRVLPDTELVAIRILE